MEIDLVEAMRSRTDEELHEIVKRDHHEYTAEALSAARAELQTRGLSIPEPLPESSTRPRGTAFLLTGIGVTIAATTIVHALVYGTGTITLGLVISGLTAFLFVARRRGL